MADVAEHPLPQVTADLDLTASAVDHDPGQHRAGSRQHLTYSRQPRAVLDQLHMNTGVLMRHRHADIINNRRAGVESSRQLVQSTGQWGGRTPKALGRELDGQLWDEMPNGPTDQKVDWQQGGSRLINM
jgi:hypothetical protein